MCETFKYDTVGALIEAAQSRGLKIHETAICFYFYVFENRTAREFHAFYK